jgi:hypothetical protein
MIDGCQARMHDSILYFQDNKKKVGLFHFVWVFYQWIMTGPVTASSPGRPRSTRLFIVISHAKWKRTEEANFPLAEMTWLR